MKNRRNTKFKLYALTESIGANDEVFINNIDGEIVIDNIEANMDAFKEITEKYNIGTYATNFINTLKDCYGVSLTFITTEDEEEVKEIKAFVGNDLDSISKIIKFIGTNGWVDGDVEVINIDDAEENADGTTEKTEEENETEPTTESVDSPNTSSSDNLLVITIKNDIELEEDEDDDDFDEDSTESFMGRYGY